MIDDRQLIQQLVSADLISPTALREGLALAERDDAPLYNVLLDYQLIEERSVVAMASKILNVDSIHLATAELDASVAQMIPAELATSSQSLPLEVINDGGIDVLRLAMADPIDVMAMDEIASHIGIDIRPVLAGPTDLQAAIERLYDMGTVPPEGPSFEDLILESDEAHDLFDDDSEDVEPLDIDSDDDIQLSQEFVIDEEEVDEPGASVLLSGEFVLEADDEDELVELDDAFLLEDFDDATEPAELLDEPTGLGSSEDSWAAMFDAAAEGSLPPYVSDDEPLATDAVDEEHDEQALQEQESSPEALKVPPSMQTDAGNQTQIGSPAQMGIDKVISDYEAQHPVELEPKHLDQSDNHDKFEEGLDEIFELEIDDVEENEDHQDDEPRSASAQQPGRPSSMTPLGVGARAKSSPSEEIDVHEDDNDPGRGRTEKKKKPVVPSSIRAALARAAKKKKRNAQPKVPDDEPSEQQEEAETKSTLGRIAVKKVAVPAFEGAIEKRSDRERHTQKTPLKGMTSIQEDNSPKTREIPLAEMATLMSDSDQTKSSATVEMPANLDAPRILYRLLQLMLAKELISTDELNALIDGD